MWPFEPRRDVLRIGRLGVELWQREPTGLVRTHAMALDQRDSLSAALKTLLKAQPKSRIALDVVLESAWLPVVLLETGHEVWAQDAVAALLRHRLSRAHDERDDPVANWMLEVDHQPGDRFGLGYGLSPRVRAVIEQACSEAGRTAATLQPALQWGLRQCPSRTGWCVWLEQDRALMAFRENGRVTALQPCADVPRDSAQLAKAIRIEQLRSGIDTAPTSVVLAGWEPPFATGMASGVTWFGVAAQPTVPASTSPVGSVA